MTLNKLPWVVSGPYIGWVTSKEKKKNAYIETVKRIKIYGLNNSNCIKEKGKNLKDDR